MNGSIGHQEDDIQLLELQKKIWNTMFEPTIENQLVETDMDASEYEISIEGERDIYHTKRPRTYF